MKKIYVYTSQEGETPFAAFLDSLNEKQQKKLEYALKCMSMGMGSLSEPQVKHFSIERYRRLYELREKAQILIRVIFALDTKENVILLSPFIKRHKRDTSKALETSLKMLEDIKRNPAALSEYAFSPKGCGK
ncbi:MAG: type II toxin-antitoxin system RelE/ParE family toxin [Clostridiales bacterium]|nr:type II toxin-antitoxin system RelE/ParE family toxin [Clostridiales bacterium]